MVLEFSIVPLTSSESLSSFVVEIIKIVEKSGLDYRLTPMGTLIEGEWDHVMKVVKECHIEMKKHANRVLTNIRIDDRGNLTGRLKAKIESVEKKLGRSVKK